MALDVNTYLSRSARLVLRFLSYDLIPGEVAARTAACARVWSSSKRFPQLTTNPLFFFSWKAAITALGRTDPFYLQKLKRSDLTHTLRITWSCTTSIYLPAIGVPLYLPEHNRFLLVLSVEATCALKGDIPVLIATSSCSGYKGISCSDCKSRGSRNSI